MTVDSMSPKVECIIYSKCAVGLWLYMDTVSSQIYHVYDIVGARIMHLQDQLSSLAGDDPRRETLIAILVEFDDLKREISAFLGDAE